MSDPDTMFWVMLINRDGIYADYRIIEQCLCLAWSPRQGFDPVTAFPPIRVWYGGIHCRDVGGVYCI
ncbi:hypothetical protein MJ572_12545 [Escherichia coli]|nr:hypothetical protein MJ572_12545 [Escherichia coli]